MEEPDFSGVDPLRVPEARRRVAAINEYFRLPSPTSADATRFAASIGLSRIQFGRLATVWRNHRDPNLLVIGKRGYSNRPYGIEGRAVTIAKNFIAAIEADATLAEIAPEIERRCAAEHLRAPSRGTIWNYMRAARAASAEALAGPPRIVIGRMWFHLPVSGMPADAMPTLLAAVLLPERIIIAHRLSVDPANPPSTSEVIERLAQQCVSGAGARRILFAPDDRRVAAATLERFGLGAVRSHNRSVQRELSNAFAGRLGPLSAIYRRGLARPATKRVISRQDEPLAAEAVIAMINRAIETSNTAVAVKTPMFDIAPD